VWVVKLGGSLAYSEALRHWLTQLVAHGEGRVVLVPGGGPFADAVRIAQRRVTFSDGAAHKMALRAMDQYGLMLADLEPRLLTATSLQQLLDVQIARRVPVWLPAIALDDHPEIPPSWEVTSDSLAAWLAGKLAARHLVLVKARALGRCPVAQTDLVRAGVVDNAFPRFHDAARFEVRCLDAQSYDRLPELFTSAPSVGTRILASAK
jgi:aspartokinase-like uncharacterized kinase